MSSLTRKLAVVLQSIAILVGAVLPLALVLVACSVPLIVAPFIAVIGVVVVAAAN